MPRLFVAIELPDEIRETLGSVSRGLPGARWVAPENMHLTLRFLGDLDDEQTETVRVALATVDADCFELRLRGLGQFLSGRLPTTLWAGVDANPSLEELHASVARALFGVGIPLERRPFHAHVTIARLQSVNLRRLHEYLTEYADLETGAFPAREFALVSSQLRPEGPLYTIEETYPLRGRVVP